MVGISDDTFWKLTPKTIQIYFKAYRERRKTQIQDLWLQGKYFAHAISSTLQFSNKQPPPYPEMPFKEDTEKELAQNEEWLKAQRAKAMNHFMTFLSRKNKR